MESLQELVLLDEAQAREAVKEVNTALQRQRWALSNGSVSSREGMHWDGWDREKGAPWQEMILEVSLCMCSALYADWVLLRQQRARELRNVVVAAVTAAVQHAAAAGNAV